MSAPAETDRKKLVTVYLPIEMGVLVAILTALEPLVPGDTPFSDIFDSDDGQITFYAPEVPA